MRSGTVHLGAAHPLAEVATGHCSGHRAPLLGGVACGACWERAIRDDERVVIEFGLPRELDADTSAVDEIAVERACDGDDVRLTEPERAAAIHVLRDRGLTLREIADRLRVPDRVVFRETARTPRSQAQARRRGGAAA